VNNNNGEEEDNISDVEIVVEPINEDKYLVY
jgi:hypothetical protein